MILLSPEQTAALKDWFLPELPGPLIGLHVIQTGNGACFVDRWPDPQAVLVDTAGNYGLSGDPGAFTLADLRSRLHGFVEASNDFLPLLKTAFPASGPGTESSWCSRLRVASFDPDLHLRRRPPQARTISGVSSPEVDWISKTWGGPPGLAASGCAWGAFVEGVLASVACTFFCGETYEDIGVITEPEYRGLGLSAACASSLCDDIRARGAT
jgi:hypothetical protein